MITDKKSLQFYLDADRYALGMTSKSVLLSRNPVWRFERLMRKCEYLKNTKAPKFIYALTLLRYERLSTKLGFSISLNCFGPGLRINHYGLLTVNSKARIGKWCDIHQGVNIGENGYVDADGSFVSQVPNVGDYVFIGLGAKLYGNINVGDSVRIAANAVVSCDVEKGHTIAGYPSCQVVREHHSNKGHISSVEFEKSFMEKFPQYEDYLR